MLSRVVIVCVGNICRSPMAEALWRARIGSGGAGGVVESAGIAALVGAEADPKAAALVRHRDLDISSHRARQLSQDMVQRASLVIVMEAEQQRWIESQWPEARGRVQALGRWGGFEVPDPYRGGDDDFRVAFDLIERGIEDWNARLGGAPATERQ